MSVWTCMLTHRKVVPMLLEFSRVVAYIHTFYCKLHVRRLSPTNTLPCMWPVFPSQGKIDWTCISIPRTEKIKNKNKFKKKKKRGSCFLLFKVLVCLLRESQSSWHCKRDGEKMQNIHLDGNSWRSPPPRNPSCSLQQLCTHTFCWSAFKAKLHRQRCGFRVLWWMRALINASSEAAQDLLKVSMAFQSPGRALRDIYFQGRPSALHEL